MNRVLMAALAAAIGLTSAAFAADTQGLKLKDANSKNRMKTIKADKYPVRHGKSGLVFQVKDGQCKGNRTYDDCKGGRERSEVKDTKAIKTDTETWYAFSLLIPKSTPHIEPSGTILAQFQDTKGSGEITLGFEMWGDGLYMNQDDPRTQQVDDMAPPKPMIDKRLISNGQLRGRWHDIKVQAVWSVKDSGLIRVWLNDRLVHEHRGRNLNRNVAPAFKFGVYRTGLKKYRASKGAVPTQTVFFDSVARGPSQASVTITD
ncbi:MAG: heparin lyase I family protein [Pseudomonadota bacterium]